MRILFILLFLTTHSAFLFSQELGRVELRNTFQTCTTKEITEKFHNSLSAKTGNEPILIGYRGAVTALRAKYSSNPFKKYNYCRDGLDQLNKAIKQSPNDIELRYLRLAIESNIPSFLGMNCNVEDDKKSIIDKLTFEKDIHLKKLITSFLLKSSLCSENEKKLLALR